MPSCATYAGQASQPLRPWLHRQPSQGCCQAKTYSIRNCWCVVCSAALLFCCFARRRFNFHLLLRMPAAHGSSHGASRPKPKTQLNAKQRMARAPKSEKAKAMKRKLLLMKLKSKADNKGNVPSKRRYLLQVRVADRCDVSLGM